MTVGNQRRARRVLVATLAVTTTASAAWFGAGLVQPARQAVAGLVALIDGSVIATPALALSSLGSSSLSGGLSEEALLQMSAFEAGPLTPVALVPAQCDPAKDAANLARPVERQL